MASRKKINQKNLRKPLDKVTYRCYNKITVKEMSRKAPTKERGVIYDEERNVHCYR